MESPRLSFAIIMGEVGCWSTCKMPVTMESQSFTIVMDLVEEPIWHSYIFVRVCFLICDILEYVYHSACDKKFSVQLDSYLVQRKYIFRIYVSNSITTQSSSPYKSRARINLDGHSNYITDTVCQLVAQNSCVVTCVQIYYVWTQGDVMKYLASTHIYVIWVAQSYYFHEWNRSIVHGGERDTLSEFLV